MGGGLWRRVSFGDITEEDLCRRESFRGHHGGRPSAVAVCGDQGCTFFVNIF